MQPTEQTPKQRNIEYSHTDFFTISHRDVMKYRNVIKDKIVILGTINEEADTHITPLGKMPGMKIQAFACFRAWLITVCWQQAVPLAYC